MQREVQHRPTFTYPLRLVGLVVGFWAIIAVAIIVLLD